MKIVVTGASGYIGSKLINALSAKNYQLIPLSHKSSFEKMKELFEKERPEAVIHLASLFIAEHQSQDVDALIQGNILFGTHLLEAMRMTGVRQIINTGTSWQHFSTDGQEPACLYAATKTAFENILRFYSSAAGISAMTLKIYDTYGPNDPRPKLIPRLLQRAKENQLTPMALSKGEQHLCLVHIDDIVQAYVRALDLLQGQKIAFSEYFLRSDEEISLKNLVNLLERVTGKDLNIDLGARPYRQREVMQPWQGGLVLPGWQARISLQEGLEKVWHGQI